MNINELNEKLKNRNIKIITYDKKKTLFHCLLCNHEWIKHPGKVLYDGYGCKQCYLQKRRTIKGNSITENNLINENKIIKRGKPLPNINELNEKLKNRNIKLLSFQNTTSNCKAECLSCNHIWEPLYNNLIYHKTNCPNCQINKKINRIKTYNKLKSLDEINKKFINKNIEVLLYTGSNKGKMCALKCKICNHTWSSEYDYALKTLKMCPMCRKQQKRFSKNIFEEFNTYRQYVESLTESNNKTYTKYDNNKNYHIDHKFSVYDAFINYIPVWMVAAPINLQLIPASDNCKKFIYSSISLKEFIIEALDWIKLHPEYILKIQENSIEDKKFHGKIFLTDNTYENDYII